MLAHMRFLKNIFPNPREKYLRSHASTRFQQRKGTLPGASYRMSFNAASQEVLSVSVEKHCFLKNVPPSGTCLEQSGWAVSCAGTTGCFIDFKPTEWKFGNGVSSGEQGALDPARERGRMAGCPHGAGSFVGCPSVPRSNVKSASGLQTETASEPLGPTRHPCCAWGQIHLMML